MLTSIYLAALIVGGILLAASIFLGGHGDADADAGADADASGDADAGADHDAGVDHGQQGLVTAHADSHGALDGVVAAFLSLRFWTFFAAFFGLTGLALAQLSPDTGPTLGLGLALGMGVAVGQVATVVFRRLAAQEVGTAPSERDYAGLSARVLVGFGRGDLGKIRVTLKGSVDDLVATTDEEQPFSRDEEALVVEMAGTQAVVARVGTKPARESAEKDA